MTDKVAAERFRASAEKHFSKEFIDELARKGDEELFWLLGELLQPSSGSTVEWSEEVAEETYPIEQAYSEAYKAIDATIEDMRGRNHDGRHGFGRQRVSDVEFDYFTAQCGGRYYA